MKTIAEVSQETIKIENYLSSRNYGEFVSYADIEENTGVSMDIKGKGYMRTALRRMKCEYSPVRGAGIELASEKNTTRIIIHKLEKIDNAVKRSERTYDNLIPFHEKLNQEELKSVQLVGAAFGAIRLAAANGKRYLKSQKTFIPQSREFVKI
jgi:hypothetical protein